MSNSDSVLFHKTFTDFNADWISKKVMECVDKLYKERRYHKIRVIEHQINHEGHHSTTIIATMDDIDIDIGFPPN